MGPGTSLVDYYYSSYSSSSSSGSGFLSQGNMQSDVQSENGQVGEISGNVLNAGGNCPNLGNPGRRIRLNLFRGLSLLSPSNLFCLSVSRLLFWPLLRIAPPVLRHSNHIN